MTLGKTLSGRFGRSTGGWWTSGGSWNTGITRPQGKAAIPRVLSLRQLRQLVTVSKPPYDRALVLTLLDTMCRIGELVGRRKEHISGNSLEVWGKTGGRLVPLSPDVRAYLLSLPTDSLFPVSGGEDHPAGVVALQGRVRRMMRRSGLQGRKLGPHTLRHSAATGYVDSGGDLKSLSLILGHTTTAMSERYVHLALGALQEKHARYGVLGAIRGLGAAQPVEDLPVVALPADVLDVPLELAGRFVVLFLSQDRRPASNYYYIRARLEGPRAGRARAPWHICSLTPAMPLNEVDAVRQALLVENQRRRKLSGSVGPETLVGAGDLLGLILRDPPEELVEIYAGEPVIDADVDLFDRFIIWYCRVQKLQLIEGGQENVRALVARMKGPSMAGWWHMINVWGSRGCF